MRKGTTLYTTRRCVHTKNGAEGLESWLRYTNTRCALARDGEKGAGESGREKEREEEERRVESSRVESAVAGCEFSPTPDPLPPLPRLSPSKLVASITPRPSGESTYSPPPLTSLYPSAARSRVVATVPLLQPLAHLSPSPSGFVVSRFTPLSLPAVSPHGSSRGVPTTLSRIYYAQFSCSHDVSSSQASFRSSQRFFSFVSFYTPSLSFSCLCSRRFFLPPFCRPSYVFLFPRSFVRSFVRAVTRVHAPRARSVCPG